MAEKPPRQYPSHLTIKQWADEDRPREKLLSKGKQSLTEAELLAILIRAGTRQDSAVELGKKLLARVKNDMHELSRLSVRDIVDFKIKGLGPTKAIAIVAALELGRRRQSAEVKTRLQITESQQAFEILHPLLVDKTYEEFWVLMLNRANHVMDSVKISSGGLAGTVADARMIFNEAIRAHATAIILCHNHPSGNVSPSQLDIDLTKRLQEAGRVLEIAVHDHIIIGGDNYYSFADEGEM